MVKKQFRKEVLKEYVDTWVFKILFVISIVIMLYGLINYALNQSYAMALLTYLSLPSFIICGVLLPLLVTTISVYNIFNRNMFLTIRLETKRERLTELLKCILYTNTFVFIVIIVINLIGLNLVCAKNLGFGDMYLFYNIPNIVYLLFYMIRFYLLTMIILVINGYLLEKSLYKTVFLLNAILYGLLFVMPYVPISDSRNSVFGMPLFIGEYFTLISFSTFTMEVLCTGIYIVLLLMFLRVLVYTHIDKEKINRYKYLIFSDVNYTFQFRKKILIFYFSFLIIFSLIKIFILNYDDSGFFVVLGVGANREENFMNIVSFFINVLLFILLGTMLFVKDISRNKSNLFLRMDSSCWSRIKICSIILQFALLLLIAYGIVFIIFILFDTVPSNIIQVYFTNLIFISTLEIIILLAIYNNTMIRILTGVGFVALIAFHLISWIKLSEYIPYLLLILLCFLWIFLFFFKKNKYKIFESEE